MPGLFAAKKSLKRIDKISSGKMWTTKGKLYV